VKGSVEFMPFETSLDEIDGISDKIDELVNKEVCVIHIKTIHISTIVTLIFEMLTVPTILYLKA